MSTLPMELVVSILEYSGDLRIMKIRMDKQNMKYLFEHMEDLEFYLFEKTSSFSCCLTEAIYSAIIGMLSYKQITIDDIFDEVCRQFNTLNEKYFDDILEMIINDYNNYYLNDDYYYGGYWYDETWVKNKNHDETKMKTY